MENLELASPTTVFMGALGRNRVASRSLGTMPDMANMSIASEKKGTKSKRHGAEF